MKNLKTLFNRVKMSNFLSLLAITIMIVVFSLCSVGWDPDKVGWDIFLVNLAFLLFLAIYGLFFGESTGSNFFKTLATGAYQYARDLWLVIKEKIYEKGFAHHLPEYMVWRYQKDYEGECRRRLSSLRIFNKRVLDLSEDEIDLLHREPIEKKWSEDSPYPNKIEHFSRLSDEQYELVKGIVSGKIKIDYIEDYNFYLVDSNSSDEQLITQIKNTEKIKMKILWKQRISKLLITALFAIIGAGIAVDKAGGQSNAQTIINLIQRISVLVTSIICGFNTARLLNKEDIKVLNYKTSYLSVFVSSVENNEFTPLDYEEKAKREYEKSQKEKQEILNNLVVPEVVMIEEVKHGE